MQPSTVPPEEAEALLESVEQSRAAAEQRAGAYWFAPVIVGALLWLSVFFFPVWDGAGVAVYWLAVTPFAYFAIKRYERIQLRLSGAVSRAPSSFQLITASFIAACVACGAIGGAIGEPDVIGYGPVFAVAAACAVGAWRDRSRRLAVGAVGVLGFLLAVVVFSDSVEPPAFFFAIAGGVNLMIDGFSARNKRGA